MCWYIALYETSSVGVADASSVRSIVRGIDITRLANDTLGASKSCLLMCFPFWGGYCLVPRMKSGKSTFVIVNSESTTPMATSRG